MTKSLMTKVGVCACLVLLLPFLCLAEVGLEDAIGVWLFDEGKGEVAKDSSANGNHGELIGGPKWVKGKFGQGLEFDGKGTSVETESADKLKGFELGDKTDFTATAWFKTDHVGGFVMSKTLKAADWTGFEVKFSNGMIRTCLQTEPATVCDNRGAGLNNGKWRHVAVVFSRTKGERYVYIDGEQQGNPINQKVVQGSIDHENGLAIGVSMGDHRGGSFFKGIMDQVAIFKGELTKEDIQQVMNNLEEVLSVSPVGCLTSTWAQVKLRLN